MNINAEISMVVGAERDYEYCLNAMHEAEKVLTPLQQRIFLDSLDEIVPHGDAISEEGYVAHTNEMFQFVHASAAQRAEAFLRTLGLWHTLETWYIVDSRTGKRASVAGFLSREGAVRQIQEWTDRDKLGIRPDCREFLPYLTPKRL